MRLPVYLYGHPVLRKIAAPVSSDYNGLKELVEKMYETMYDSEGVGLAAPQIGLSDRIVVIDADPVKDSFPECEGRKLTLINPEIEILDGETVVRDEGCLSLPGLSERVPRVEISGLNGSMRISNLTKKSSQVSSRESFSMSATILKECSISTISR